MESIIKARTEGGPFRTIFDFGERVDLTSVNRRIVESLIKAGACDSLEGNRAQLTVMIDSAMETGQRAMRDRESGQAGLFGMVAAMSRHIAPNLCRDLPDWTAEAKTRRREGSARHLRRAVILSMSLPPKSPS